MKFPCRNIFLKYEGNIWLKIFHHKYPQGKLFTSDEECNLSLHENKFSVLKYIDETFKIDNYYKFLLEYPNEKRFVRWDQELSIMTKYSSVSAVVHTKGLSYFNGVAVSSENDKTCFDGSPDSQINKWWYSIGTKVDYHGGFPGIWNSADKETNEMSFWIMIKHVSDINKIPVFRQICSLAPNRRLLKSSLWIFVFSAIMIS